MAKFTQDVRPTNDPSYIGLSREPDRQRPNQSLGTLFEGIGEGLSGVVRTWDNENQVQIKEAAYRGVDEIRANQGVDAAVATDGLFAPSTMPAKGTGPGGAPNAAMAGNRPPNASAVTSQMQRLTEAYQQGAIGDTAYYRQLEALSRQIRSRYPGYREEIDAQIKSITGINPANSLRSEIAQQLAAQSAASNSTADKYLTYAKQKNEFLPPDFWQRYGTPNAYPETYIYQHVGKQERDKLEYDVRMRELDESKKVGENTADTAQRFATGVLNNEVAKSLSTVADGISGPGKSITTKILELSKNGMNVNPQDLEAMTVQLNTLETNQRLALLQRVNTPGPGGISIAQHVNDPVKVQKMIDTAMEPIVTLKNAVSKGDFSLAAANLRYSQGLQNTTGRELLDGSEVYRRAVAAKNQMGDAGFGILINSNNNLRDITNNLISNGISKGVTDPNAKFGTELQQLKKDPNVNGAAYKEYMTRWARVAQAPDMKPEGLKNHLNFVFKEGGEGEHLLSKFADKDKVSVYLQMGGPSIAGAVKRLNDPEVTANYLKWMDTGLSTVFGTQLRGMAKESNTNGLWTAAWDPTVGRFVPQVVPGSEKKLEQLGLFIPGSVPNFRNIMGPEFDNLEQINKGLQAWAPAMKTMGKDPTQALAQFMDQYSFRIDGTKAAKGGLFDTIYNAITGGTGKPKEKDAQDLGGERFQKQSPLPGKQSGLIDLDAQTQARSFANTEDLTPQLREFAFGLSSKYNIPITSGFRDKSHNDAVGGASSSQHLHGNAVDLSLKGISEAEKAKVIADILADPRTGGIGHYDNESIHVDFRQGGRAAWGQDRTSKSLATAPAWFRSAVEAWQAGKG